MELNAATEILATLPPRIRQVAILRATGTGYKEIAELTGNTERTVHRLVRRANESIGEAVREATRYERSGSPRAERLESLERKPPRWLVVAIGRAPGRASSTSGLLAWRRAALAIDDYRRVAGFADEHQPIGAQPTEPEAARAHAAATRAVTRLREAREHGRPFDSSR